MRDLQLPAITVPYLSQQDEDEDDTLTSACCPNLPLKERIIGWATCFAFGWVISLASFGGFTQLMLGRPWQFAVCYTTGNMLQLASTFFLLGPEKQFQNMKHKKRRVASAVYLICAVMTVVAVFVAMWPPVIVLLVLTQSMALFWYSISYVPYGRTMVRRGASRLWTWVLE